jgi:hydrocephalus-inducing protein
MVFEYVPSQVGEHESRWLFKIPSEKITQEFLVVGRVNEPNVLFESGKLKFGPLLLGGKAKETVRIINEEHIPFAFNFTNASVKGSPDYGDSLKVSPMSGLVPAYSEQLVEIQFNPKYEINYNYNLQCNVKRKARPLVLNVKGEGYQIHHTVMADEPAIKATSSEPTKLHFGEFFINEVKTKKVELTNNGEFNFDFMWKRAVNKYVTISPENGTVQKGSTVEVTIQYSASAENELKNYKATLSVLSGPKYDFHFTGAARKPGVRLN